MKNKRIKKRLNPSIVETFKWSFFVISFFILFLIITLIGIIFASEINLCFFSKDENISDLINLLLLAITGSTLITILVSSVTENKRRKDSLQQITIDLFKEWRDKNLHRQRMIISKEIAPNWSDEKFREEFCKSFLAIEKSNNFIISEEQIQAMSDIIGFYTKLSLYRGNEEDIKNLNYFYYPWYRKMFYDIAEYRDDSRQKVLNKNNFLTEKENKEIYDEILANLSLAPMLKRIDKLCDFENIPFDNDIMSFHE